MSESTRPPTDNRLLAALPREDYERIAPHLEPVELHNGEVLYQAGQTIDYVYFPVNAMVSLVAQMAGGAEVEVGVTGFEGAAGIPVLLGVERSPLLNMAQIPGGALKVRARPLLEEFRKGGPLQQSLLRYSQSVMVMTSQAAACNALHTLSERLAR